MTLPDFFRLIRRHCALALALTLACGALATAWAYLRLADAYTATVTAHVSMTGADDTATSLNTSLSAAQMATNDVIGLMQSAQLDGRAAQLAGLPSLSGYAYTVTAGGASRVVAVRVTGTDAAGAARVADALVAAAAETIPNVIRGCEVRAMGTAAVPSTPSGPDRPLYVALGLGAGAALAITAILVIDLMDARLRSVADAEELLGMPVLGCVPTEGR